MGLPARAMVLSCEPRVHVGVLPSPGLRERAEEALWLLGFRSGLDPGNHRALVAYPARL